MRRLLILPTLLLAGLAVAALALVTATSRATAEALERRLEDVRRADALAFRIAHLSSRDDHDLLAYRFGGGREALARIAATEKELEALAQELGRIELSPRGRDLWREVLAARALRSRDRDALVRAVDAGAPADVERAYQRWRLSAGRADALVADLSVLALRRVEHAVSEVDRVRSRSAGLLVTVLAVSAGVVLALSFFVDAWVVRPIQRMTDAARRLASGHAMVVPGGDRSDELGVLARAFTATAADLVRANAELARSVRARDEFLSLASHELKTPLTALRLQLQNGQRRWEQCHGEPPPAWIDAALRQLDRLGALVAELLDLTRIRSGQLALAREPTDLAALVRGVADRLRDVLARTSNGLAVEIEEGIAVACDPARIEQVLANLLTNAGQHAPGTQVTVRARLRGGRAELEVEDGGGGIPEAARERIFEAYEKVDGRAGQGLGLGLYIARQIVEAHDGSIRAAAGAAGGALFTVVLPADAPPGEPPAGPPAGSGRPLPAAEAG